MTNKAVFIISYKRADNIVTLDWLKKIGYRGQWYIVIDDKDPEMDKYLTKYGSKVCVFSKEDRSRIGRRGRAAAQREQQKERRQQRQP